MDNSPFAKLPRELRDQIAQLALTSKSGELNLADLSLDRSWTGSSPDRRKCCDEWSVAYEGACLAVTPRINHFISANRFLALQDRGFGIGLEEPHYKKFHSSPEPCIHQLLRGWPATCKQAREESSTLFFSSNIIAYLQPEPHFKIVAPSRLRAKLRKIGSINCAVIHRLHYDFGVWKSLPLPMKQLKEVETSWDALKNMKSSIHINATVTAGLRLLTDPMIRHLEVFGLPKASINSLLVEFDPGHLCASMFEHMRGADFPSFAMRLSVTDWTCAEAEVDRAFKTAMENFAQDVIKSFSLESALQEKCEEWKADLKKILVVLIGKEH